MFEDVLSRWELLENWEADYTVAEKHSPAKELMQQVFDARGARLGHDVFLLEGERTYDCRARFLNDRFMLDQQLRGGGADIVELSNAREVRSYHGMRTELLYSGKSTSAPNLGVISDRMPLPKDPLCTSLGLRGVFMKTWLSKDSLRKTKLAFVEGKIASLVFSVGAREEHIWSLSQELGYSPTAYRKIFDGKVIAECHNTDFRRIGSLMIPYKCELRTYFIDGEGESHVILSQSSSVSRFVLTPDGNSPASYFIEWPVGARVADARKKDDQRGFLIRDGAKVLTDEKMDEIVRDKKRRIEPTRSTSSMRQRQIIIAINVGIIVVILCVLLLRTKKAA